MVYTILHIVRYCVIAIKGNKASDSRVLLHLEFAMWPSVIDNIERKYVELISGKWGFLFGLRFGAVRIE